jgi:hypothetical protein
VPGKSKRGPQTIAIVRDHGWLSQIDDPVIRADGWIQNPFSLHWFSPENLISILTFAPRKWDGNSLAPGTICELPVWAGVTSERPSGQEIQCVVVIGRDKKRAHYTVLMPDGSKRSVLDKILVPLLEPGNAQE